MADGVKLRGEELRRAVKAWYAPYASRLGLSPDPYDPEHRYDYESAFLAGAKPGSDGHWPSEFKRKDHPNRFVVIDGVLTDTITGKPAAGSAFADVFGG